MAQINQVRNVYWHPSTHVFYALAHATTEFLDGLDVITHIICLVSDYLSGHMVCNSIIYTDTIRTMKLGGRWKSFN